MSLLYSLITLSTCKRWSKLVGGWTHFCMKRLRTLYSQIFKSKNKESKTFSSWCPFQGLFNGTTLMQIHSGRMVPLSVSTFVRLKCFLIAVSLHRADWNSSSMARIKCFQIFQTEALSYWSDWSAFSSVRLKDFLIGQTEVFSHWSDWSAFSLVRLAFLFFNQTEVFSLWSNWSISLLVRLRFLPFVSLKCKEGLAEVPPHPLAR